MTDSDPKTALATLSGAVLMADPPPSQEDDIIASTEKALRDECSRYTNEVLRLATGLVAAGPKAASRGLHLTEGLASLQSEMLRLLGMAKRKRRRRRVGPYGMAYSTGALGYDDDDGDPETATGDAMGETFGNKALNQMIAMVKPLMQQGGLLGMAQKKPGSEVESLTRALAEANKANLPQDIRDSIMNQLKAALAANVQTPALAMLPEPLPDPTPTIEPPIFVCGSQEGV